MIDRPLASDVAQAVQTGMGLHDVREILKAAGWPAEMIKEFMGHAPASRPRSSGALLHVQGVSKRFGSKIILEGAVLDVHTHDMIGIVGQSGVGKTVLLSIMVGALRPDGGDVVITDAQGRQTSVFDSMSARSMIGFAPQQSACYGALTVVENIEHFASIYGLQPQQCVKRAKELMALLGIKNLADQSADSLSAGQKKRLDIACAVVHSPALLVLDEPLADLDPISRRELWKALKNITASTAVVLTSHAHADIEAYCTRVILLCRKSLVDLGSPSHISETYFKNYAVHLELERTDYARLLTALKRRKDIVLNAQRRGSQIIVHTQQPYRFLAMLRGLLAQEHCRLVSLSIAKPSLCEVFERLIQE